MDSPISTPPLFHFTDPRQVRIYQRLLLVGPGPAAMFFDACRIIETEPSFSTMTHLVGHLVRETVSAVRDVLKPMSNVETDEEGAFTGDSEQTQKDEIRSALNYLGLESEPIAQIWLNMANEPHRWAHRENLLQPRPDNEDFREFWNRAQTVFDIVLDKLASHYLESLPLVEKLLVVKQPTHDHLEQLCQYVPHNAITLGYFFGKLENPAWLGMLRAKGYFRYPPAPIQDIETGSFRLLGWPASSYLARMAPKAPKPVHDIAMQIPDTRNVFVHADLADAALALPPDLAKDFVPKAITWLQEPNPIILGDRLGQMMEKLAKGGQVEPAFDLARCLLAVSSEVQSLPTADGTNKPKGEPRGCFSEWEYGRILKLYLPTLCEVAPEKTLRMLCELLEAAMSVSSFIWRPAIEEHPQNANHMHRFIDLLITAVRDAAEVLVGIGSDSALKIVEKHEPIIFKRISLYLRRKYPALDPEGTVAMLTEAGIVNDRELHHEFYWLLSEQFGSLPVDAQARYLELVDKGPDILYLVGSPSPFTGEIITQDEVDERIRHWQYEKLLPIRASLHGKWDEHFEILSREYPEPQHPDFFMYFDDMQWGPTSPVTANEFGNMEMDALVAYLHAPIYLDKESMQSMEGIGRELATAVFANPQRFAAEAARFKELDPTYIRSLIEGFTKAFAQHKTKEWGPVLELCQWVVEQKREIPERLTDSLDADPDWGQTRLAIARLCKEGFTAGESELPYVYRQAVWNMLALLMTDSQPTPKYEEQYGGSNMGPATLAINTVRGTAMHAVMQYVLWVRRNNLGKGEGIELKAQGGANMPEVMRVLDEHLDPSHEPSLAVRSVYGQWFPWLMLLDETWAAQAVPRIFPEEDSFRDLWYSAWDTYVAYCRAYDNVFSLLSSVYVRAIERISMPRPFVGDHGQPDVASAHHLMTLYWRGTLELGDPNGLLGQFYERANDNLRVQALGFIGRSLQATKDDVSLEVKTRIKNLWTWRLGTASTAQAGVSHTEELGAFGELFISRKFDDVWAIEQLEKALQICGWAEPDRQVVEYLAELAPLMPAAVVRCFTLMAESGKPGWYLDAWGKAPRTILATATKSDDASAKEAAIEEVHRLGARGYLGFRDLLQAGN